MSNIVVVALYKFAELPDYREMQPRLQEFCIARKINGTILLAAEGINGTVAGSRPGIDALLKYLRADARLADMEHKESYVDTLPFDRMSFDGMSFDRMSFDRMSFDRMPFDRMKVRLKKEIVTLGVAGVDPNKKVGIYVAPENWNALIADPDVILIDTRNAYEYDIGTFQGARNPHTTTFRQFPAYIKNNLDPAKHKKIAMFCTGGIRCEKASSFMLEQGFEEVYHLQGGILKYLESVPAEQSQWQGECFVFDQRVAVGQGLARGTHEQCYACRHPVSPAEKASPQFQDGLSCPHCFDSLSEQTRARVAERQKQVVLAKKRGQKHIGVPLEQQKIRSARVVG